MTELLVLLKRFTHVLDSMRLQSGPPEWFRVNLAGCSPMAQYNAFVQNLSTGDTFITFFPLP